ncbi:TPA: hypothetical protein EYP45_02390 [Candidatus Peregrinibacteria bacterium]|nr:hypothetical protein [Candidatus Peregrinibacteria bacterium]HIQ57755.1 hypothetical protein [Candidatus Gracilibacteria bacterium]
MALFSLDFANKEEKNEIKNLKDEIKQKDLELSSKSLENLEFKNVKNNQDIRALKMETEIESIETQNLFELEISKKRNTEKSKTSPKFDKHRKKCKKCKKCKNSILYLLFYIKN